MKPNVLLLSFLLIFVLKIHFIFKYVYVHVFVSLLICACKYWCLTSEPFIQLPFLLILKSSSLDSILHLVGKCVFSETKFVPSFLCSAEYPTKQVYAALNLVPNPCSLLSVSSILPPLSWLHPFFCNFTCY